MYEWSQNPIKLQRAIAMSKGAGEDVVKANYIKLGGGLHGVSNDNSINMTPEQEQVEVVEPVVAPETPVDATFEPEVAVEPSEEIKPEGEAVLPSSETVEPEVAAEVAPEVAPEAEVAQ